MSRGDGTGSGGLGPMTPPSPIAYAGGFYQPPLKPKQEMEMLAEDAKALKGQLDSINKRIAELEKSKKE